jgi:predicted nucleic acid-binding protein
MRKQKIYLDTSVISYLDQPERLEKYEETHILWDLLRQGEYDVYLSTITIEELGDCKDEIKQEILLKYVNGIDCTILNTSEETEKIANMIIKNGILTQKSFDDCLHIACAVLAECDIIVSWNFKHLVNVKTIRGVRAITELTGYRSIEIYTPTMLLVDNEEEI